MYDTAVIALYVTCPTYTLQLHYQDLCTVCVCEYFPALISQAPVFEIFQIKSSLSISMMLQCSTGQFVYLSRTVTSWYGLKISNWCVAFRNLLYFRSICMFVIKCSHSLSSSSYVIVIYNFMIIFFAFFLYRLFTITFVLK
jgi:hypothetical protein